MARASFDSSQNSFFFMRLHEPDPLKSKIWVLATMIPPNLFFCESITARDSTESIFCDPTGSVSLRFWQEASLVCGWQDSWWKWVSQRRLEWEREERWVSHSITELSNTRNALYMRQILKRKAFPLITHQLALNRTYQNEVTDSNKLN